MTLAQLVIVPGVLLALFAAGLLALAARLALAWLRLLAARRATAALPVQRYQEARDLNRRQADVIAAVITELSAHPGAAGIFPQDVRDAIYAAHDAASRKELH
jgi:ABC-type spermidine/putrescine transport system permease subunit II